MTVDSVRATPPGIFRSRTSPGDLPGILERRAKANGVDFVEGVATALTPIAFFETVMVKSYETLVDSNTKVDVNTGIVAAGRLQSLTDSRDYDHELLVMKVQLAAICDAVKSTVPQEMWGEIVEKLDEAEQHQEALDVGRTPSMTLTTSPSARPSSWTKTTSFDLPQRPPSLRAIRHRGRWEPPRTCTRRRSPSGTQRWMMTRFARQQRARGEVDCDV